MVTRSTQSGCFRPLGDCLAQIGRLAVLRSALMDGARPDEDAESRVGASLELPLRDAVAMFDELRISYALIGGIAAMLYGRMRATEDVDFVAMSNHEAILAANGEVMRAHRFDPKSTWKLYHESGVEIDLWKDAYTDGIVERARETSFGGTTVRIAEPHDLVAMKLRAQRLQDDYDISEILKHTTIDDSRVRSLVTAAEFAHYQAIKQRVGAHGGAESGAT